MGKQMINAQEVAVIMECSEGFAYKMIRTLNKELRDKGYITRSGRVPRKYFLERTGLEEEG